MRKHVFLLLQILLPFTKIDVVLVSQSRIILRFFSLSLSFWSYLYYKCLSQNTVVTNIHHWWFVSDTDAHTCESESTTNSMVSYRKISNVNWYNNGQLGSSFIFSSSFAHESFTSNPYNNNHPINEFLSFS